MIHIWLICNILHVYYVILTREKSNSAEMHFSSEFLLIRESVKEFNINCVHWQFELNKTTQPVGPKTVSWVNDLTYSSSKPLKFKLLDLSKVFYLKWKRHEICEISWVCYYYFVFGHLAQFKQKHPPAQRRDLLIAYNWNVLQRKDETDRTFFVDWNLGISLLIYFYKVLS